MTKQQELIEGVENIISDKGYYFPYAEATLEILSYLNSRGVVIRERTGRHPSDRDYSDDDYTYEPLVDDGSWKG